MPYLTGIDISKWQTTTPSLTGLTFVIARASIGLSKDTMYDTHIANAKAAGKLTGAYHFNWDADADPATPDSTPEEQAQFFVKSAGDVDFLFLDVEGERAFEPDESARFIAEVHRLGKRVGLYMSASVYKWGVGQDYDWIAKWGTTPPSGDWEFWQYQGSPLDKDYFNGTLDDLRALSNKEYGQMAAITTYIPGQVATVKATANIRADANVTATRLRTLSAAETWTVVGWVTGGVDPDDGSNQWLVRWASGRWEYTAHSNVIAGPTPPATGDYTKAQYDAVVAERDAAKAALTKAQADLAAAQSSLTATQTELAKAKADLASAQAALNTANAALADWTAFKEASQRVGL